MAGPQLIYLASGNAHKAAEFAALAARDRLPIDIRSARELGGMPAVPEDTGTFVGNARQKAQALRRLSPAAAWVLADDSGLCVDALQGAPGVDSAIYAGPPGDAAANRAKLLHALAGVPAAERGGYFICVLFLLTGSGEEWIFEGRCAGAIVTAERGGGGFGYDPLFAVAGRTFAEIPESEKNRLSHRAKAWSALVQFLVGRQAAV